MFKVAVICDKFVREKEFKIRYNKIGESNVKLHRNN